MSGSLQTNSSGNRRSARHRTEPTSTIRRSPCRPSQPVGDQLVGGVGTGPGDGARGPHEAAPGAGGSRRRAASPHQALDAAQRDPSLDRVQSSSPVAFGAPRRARGPFAGSPRREEASAHGLPSEIDEPLALGLRERAPPRGPTRTAPPRTVPPPGGGHVRGRTEPRAPRCPGS